MLERLAGIDYVALDKVAKASSLFNICKSFIRILSFNERE